MADLFPEITTQEEEKKEEVSEPIESLSLSIDDNLLIAVIDKKIEEAENFYKSTLKLDRRNKENNNFWMGKHYEESKFDIWQVPYQDNIIWQDAETRIALASGRMPDIILSPAGDTPKNKESSQKLEKFLDIKIKNDATRRLIKNGLRHNILNFLGVMKCIWDPNIGEIGDFKYVIVNPKRIGLDHTATIPEDGYTAENCDIIYEYLNEALGVILSKFPDKKEDLFRALAIVRGTKRQMISKIKYLEVWFTWYDENGQIQEGVCWKYKNVILKKMKNPYYDWEGSEELNEGKLNELGEPEIGKFYRNHFERPRKPYIFFSYQNLGNSPYDDTTPVEQAIKIQKTLNKRGRQITEISDRAVPKLGFAGKYITKEEARRVTNDPNEHIWLQGADDVNKAIMAIPAASPSPILFQDLVGQRQQIDSKFATHSVTRGELVPQESGISKQITREGDLSISDDLVNIVVERVIFEMANWAIQMMKLFYTEPHLVRNMGQDGESINIQLKRDEIEDGIIVNVKASSTDKARRKAEALQLASTKAIDPYSLFEAMDESNPKEKTLRLITFLIGAQDNYALYMNTIGAKFKGQEITSQALGQGQGEGEGEGAGQGQGNDQQAILDIQVLSRGEIIQPKKVSESYLQTLLQFVNSPEFQNLSPEIKGNFVNYIKELRRLNIEG